MDSHHVLTFIGFFFAGMAVNLTPCVYPMLTVTASLFKPKKNSTENLKHSFTKAMVYVLGMVLMYSTLGYFAASTGKIFGAALQNSWVLGIVALMMVTLGLSMFGFFQLSVPSSWLNFLSGLRGTNYIGLFVSGMLVGVFAAPCIGPPVLALLAAVADNGNPVYGLTVFFIFSLGLGFPYLLLGTFSSLVTKLPKAGRWLIWVERVFGAILLGFGVFYISLALHWQNPNHHEKSFWQPYSQGKLQEALSQHKPVIVDFFAEWCFGCHEMDRTIFADTKVKAELSKVITLRLDATNIDAPEIQKIIDQYNIIGLPTVVFLDSHGREIKKARVEGAPTIQEFNKSMQIWAQEAGGH